MMLNGSKLRTSRLYNLEKLKKCWMADWNLLGWLCLSLHSVSLIYIRMYTQHIFPSISVAQCNWIIEFTDEIGTWNRALDNVSGVRSCNDSINRHKKALIRKSRNLRIISFSKSDCRESGKENKENAENSLQIAARICNDLIDRQKKALNRKRQTINFSTLHRWEGKENKKIRYDYWQFPPSVFGW